MRLSPHSMEIEQLYASLESTGIRSLAITACNSGDGATTLAQALTQRCLLAGEKTLLVDFNLHHPGVHPVWPMEIEQGAAPQLPPQLVRLEQQPVTLLGILAPSCRDEIIRLRRRDVMDHCLAQWHRQFERIIVDTSPLNRVNARNIPAQHVARSCDACTLVVMAGRTTEAMVTAAMDKLHRDDTHFLGAVFNDRDHPRLLDELQYQLSRLPVPFAAPATRLSKWLAQQSLLGIEE